jgi:hypothetical protein
VVMNRLDRLEMLLMHVVNRLDESTAQVIVGRPPGQRNPASGEGENIINTTAFDTDATDIHEPNG